MEKKFYGIFKVCVDTYRKDSFKQEKMNLFVQRVENPSDHIFVKVNDVFEQRTGGAIEQKLMFLRRLEDYENSRSLSCRFKTRYFVHECDPNGWLLLSKKERQEAEACIASRVVERFREKMAEKGIKEELAQTL